MIDCPTRLSFDTRNGTGFWLTERGGRVKLGTQLRVMCDANHGLYRYMRTVRFDHVESGVRSIPCYAPCYAYDFYFQLGSDMVKARYHVSSSPVHWMFRKTKPDTTMLFSSNQMAHRARKWYVIAVDGKYQGPGPHEIFADYISQEQFDELPGPMRARSNEPPTFPFDFLEKGTQ